MCWGGLLLLARALGGTRLGVQREVIVDDLAVGVAADAVEVAAAVGPLDGRVLGALPLLVGGAEVALELGGGHVGGWMAQGEVVGSDGWFLSRVRYSWLAVKEVAELIRVYERCALGVDAERGGTTWVAGERFPLV